jgi:hypothetical protein
MSTEEVAMHQSARKTIRISRILLTSVGIAILLTGAVAIVVGIAFKPYRYTGKAREISDELTRPDIGVPNYAYDPDPEKGTIYRDSSGKPLPDSEMQAIHERDFRLEVADYHRRLEEKQKNRVFGGTHEFFRYCGDADAVFWNPTDIEGSIESRQYYLVAKIKTVLLIVFLASLSISYIGQYARKNRIKIIVN